MVTLSFTIFSGQKNYNRAHMLFQVLCGFEPIFYTTHPNEESNLINNYWVSLACVSFLSISCDHIIDLLIEHDAQQTISL